MKAFDKNSKVSWKWGRGKASGYIKEIHTSRVSKIIKNKEVVRNGDKSNPAYLIETSGGNKVLKLHDELEPAQIKIFDKKKYYFKAGIDYRKNAELYKVAKGEQGVLICEPYKSEILPFWKFVNPEIAKKSAEKIYELFLHYLDDNDFPGADMARKFLQMGFTRSRRYYNFKGGKKYTEDNKILERGTGDKKKMESSLIFYDYWQKAEQLEKYKQLKLEWRKNFG